jgi:hypothetical protein
MSVVIRDATGSNVTIAADGIGGTQYSRSKIGWGASGTFNDVSAANPLPISDAGGSITVDGTVAVSGSVAVTGPLTDAQLRASAVPVTDGPVTSGGLSISSLVSAASTNATVAKASAGQLYGYSVFNAGDEPVYLKLYNQATTPTVGTDTPVVRLLVPAGSGANLHLDKGVAFATGIAFALTAGLADADATAVAAAEVLVNLFYK